MDIIPDLLNIPEEDISRLNDLFTPLIKNHKQSIHHIFINNEDSIMLSEKTIYTLINKGILDVKNIDLPTKFYQIEKFVQKNFSINSDINRHHPQIYYTVLKGMEF